MKKLIASLLTASLISVGAFAQSVSENAESGNINLEAAQCWAFGAQSFTNLANLKISGNYSVRSNQLTSMLTGASWVKSPFIKLSGGNITFNTKLDGNPGTTRSLKVFLIPVDLTNVAYREGSMVEIYSYNFPSATTTTLKSHSVTVPTEYLTQGGKYQGVYKVQFSWLGTGGTGRLISDDFNIPGEYYALPSQNCWPKEVIQDADKDGVPDDSDEYPNDATRAYNSYYPAKGTFGTLLFEDLWPYKGDYDFNDVVVDYNFNHVTNAQNKVVETKATIVTRANGASFKDGFAIQYQGLSNDKVVSVTGTRNFGTLHKYNANGTEQGVNNGATFVVFDNATKVLKVTTGTGINTSLSSPKSPIDTAKLVFSYRSANGNAATGGDVTLADLSADKFNPFITVNQDRGVEVHLADKAPTSLANTSLFGTKDDKSAGSTYYRTAGNLPFALNIPSSALYPTEKTAITNGYPKLIDWALSNGTAYPDWYKTLYSVNQYLYTK